MLVYISLQLSLYSSFYKKLKEEELYLNNTEGQNIIIGLSGIVLATTVISFLFKIMHWPFAGPLKFLGMVVSVICAAYIAIDAFLNYKKTKTTYGAQYLLLILPSLIFMQANVPGKNYSDEKFLANIQRNYDSKMSDISDLEYKNHRIISNYLSGDSTVNKIHNNTAKTMVYVDKIRQMLIDTTGGVNNDGKYAGRFQKDLIEVIMIGSEGSRTGKAYRLQNELNSYCQLLNSYLPDSSVKIRNIALDAKDDKSVQKYSEHSSKNFAELNFEEINLMEAIDKLSYMELRVAMAEQEFLLAYMANKK